MLIRWFEHSQIYHPQRQHDATPDSLGHPCEEVYFGETPKLHGWFFPARTDSPRRHLAILVCHGNAGNISHRLDLAAIFLQTGASVFLFDYRGYGRSTGRPGEEGTYRDAEAAYDWLRQKNFAGKHIIAFGESLGGAIATELASRRETGGLILENTFTSVVDLGSELFRWLPVRYLCSIRYHTISKLPRLKTPVLIMHSRADALIGYHHAEKNFAAALEPKMFHEVQGGHCQAVAVDRENYFNGVEQFLQLIEKTASPLTK